MTAIVPDEEMNVTLLKQKSQLHNVQEESRSFLTFSRENLSISTSEFEQNFKKVRRMSSCSRHMILSCTALFLALSCAGLELWKLKHGMAVARDIEELQRDVETLKHRFLEKDLLDELKAFEEQIFGEDQSAEDDSSSISSSNGSDYDISYDDSSVPTPSSPKYYTVTPTSKNLDTRHFSSSKGVSPISIVPCSSKDLKDTLTLLRPNENEYGHTFKQKIQERKRLLEERKTK